MYTDERSVRPQKLALSLGFLSLAVAVALAYGSPATGYELSIYEATPAGYWIGIALATLVALWVAVAGVGYVRNAAYLLAVGSIVSIVALPAIRGYHYYGPGDSMTHLGWAREMHQGTLSPLDSLYPGLHLVGTMFHEVAGIEMTRAIMLLPVVVFPLVFVIFVTLCIAYISRSRWAVPVGIFSALLLIPVNQISVHTIPHPSSQAILFIPLVIYLLFRFVEASSTRSSLFSATGAAFGLVTVALLLYHPQETMNLLALLIAVSLVQLAYRRYTDGHVVTSHRPVHAHTMLLGLLFLVWTFRHERARNRLQFVVEGLVTGGAQTLDQTGQRAVSLQTVGGSVEEVFLKLFAVTVLFCALAGLVMLASLTDGLDDVGPSQSALVTYLVAGLVPLTALFGIVFVADQGDHYFRFLGFILVPITILGGVALAELLSGLDGRFNRRALAIAACLLFVLVLPMQALTFHDSPYMYQHNQQVTEGSMEGYANAFEYRDDETVMMGVRSGPQRYVDAAYGTERAIGDLNFPGYREEVPGPVFNENVTTHYEDDRYLTTMQSDREREVELFQELRYSEEGFERLENDPAIDRVQTNGDFELYRVDGDGE